MTEFIWDSSDEIYGLNTHIAHLSEKLEKHGLDTFTPDLLNGKGPFSYNQAEEAYRYFMERIGFEKATAQACQILNDLRPRYRKVYVLGYSVGATVAWLCSATGLCDLVIGFYGSRIRDHLSIMPQCPTLLFFPEKERSFDVDPLVARLRNHSQTVVAKMPGEHGFADPFSRNYNKRSSLLATRKILSFLRDQGWKNQSPLELPGPLAYLDLDIQKPLDIHSRYTE